MAGIDAYLEWGQDLVLTPNGSIQTATGWDQVRERIIRNMLTNPRQRLPNGRMTAPDYIWDPSYGIGAASLVGQGISIAYLNDLQRRISKAVLSDAAIATNVPPSITFTQPTPQTLVVSIGVTLSNGTPGQVALAFG